MIAFVSLAAGAFAQPFTLEVRHRHLHGGGAGTLTFTASAVAFEESGKKSNHSRSWDYRDIQQLDLEPREVRIRTYDDVRWQLGRDRTYRFDGLPEGAAAALYPFLSARLDQRFVARIADAVKAPEWRIPAKMLHGTGGVSGELMATEAGVVFEAASETGSRTWRYTDLHDVSNSGPFALSLTSLDGETRFQLKQAMPEAQYNALWRRIMGANGLTVFQSRMEGSHHE